MGKAKFIDNIKELFGVEVKKENEPNRKIVKELIEKLKIKKHELKKELGTCKNPIKKEHLKDSIKILKKQIKKGESLIKE
jgi:hypothetical protein